jgi:hypothetical protein
MLSKSSVLMMLLVGTGSLVGISSIYQPANVETQTGGAAPIGSPSLTGVWKSNDGGTYYLRQIGNELWWNGMSGGNDGRTYNNVFYGTINYQTNPYTILGKWVDVPRGTNMGAGTMTLQMESYTTFQKISQSGGFGPILWERVTAN